jgi:rare lipoprotein A
MKNGKSVIVEITDRGPFVKSREIDLLKELLWTLLQQK